MVQFAEEMLQAIQPESQTAQVLLKEELMN
jgi:hypothetical protein